MTLADELRSTFLFADFDDVRLAELLDAGDEVRVEPGTVLFTVGMPADYLWVLLEGRVDLLRAAGREETVMRTMSRPGEWAGGLQAWGGEGAGYRATGRTTTAVRMFRVPSSKLGALVARWFPFGKHMIEGIYGTIRSIEDQAAQGEKLASLGRMAAGFAHELNNPASAAHRAADSLREVCDVMMRSLVRLAERQLTPEQFIALDELRKELEPLPATVGPLELADREDQLGDWLEERGVYGAWGIAGHLASVGVDVEWAAKVADRIGDAALGPGLEWVATTAAARSLLDELGEATSRVATLVQSVKTYSRLDRAPVDDVDVTEGIESTIVMLGHRLRSGVTVECDFDSAAPRVRANAGELNQVWTNLIDNAIDAMDGQGTLRVSTRADGAGIVVEIADTGHGIDPDVQRRVFEPFFTTKEPGKGTGLGLDISRRIVDRHGGEITFESKPGATAVRVCLPVAAVS